MKDGLTKAKELLQIQGDNGNWNYDPYMQGMYNGMELIIAILEDREPVYRNAPKEWLADRTESYFEPPIASEIKEGSQ
jgi:hypothetical protein